MTDVVLRAGTARDCLDVALVQVEAWRAAYTGLVPEQELRELDVPRAARRWMGLLDIGVRLVVAELDGDVVGYASSGASRDEGAVAGVGELYVLNVRPAHWRRGVGRRLHDAALAAMRDEGLATATLWLLAGNARGRAFYEALGWLPDGTGREEQVPGGVLVEIRYALGLDGVSGQG